MFCPKCGQQNPETGKFCRTCGTDLGNVSSILTGVPQAKPLVDRKGRELTWEGAITKVSMGVAFILVSFILGASGAGRGWWFWLLLPGFMLLGGGVAKIIQLQQPKQPADLRFAEDNQPAFHPPAAQGSLPPSDASFIQPESRYKTGDLVPPSVTDNTTRHLEIDKEGQTMALPKK